LPQEALAWLDLSLDLTLGILGNIARQMQDLSPSLFSYRGIIVLPSFKETFGLLADGPNAYQAPDLSANIVAALQAGAVTGSLLAYASADRFGRRWTLIIGAAVFLVGCALQLIADLSKSVLIWKPISLSILHQETLYAGRVISGIATGLCSVIPPMYVSETAPKAIRGALTTCFNLILLISLSLAFWINVNFHFHSFFHKAYLTRPSTV
jgi:MFS family permease